MKINFMHYIICCISGLLFSLGLPSFLGHEIPFLPIISVTFLFYFIFNSTISLKQKWLLLACYLFSVNLTGYYWVPKTLQVFGEIPAILAYLASSIFTLIILPQFIVLMFTKKYWDKLYQKLKTKFTTPELFIFYNTAVMLVLENFVPQQFPTHMGHFWLTLGPYMGFAPIFGIPVFSMMSYLLIFSIISSIQFKRHSYFTYFIVLLFIALNPLLVVAPKTKTKQMAVRISQASIGNYLKLESESGDFNSVDKILSFFKKLSKEPYSQEGITTPDIIMWSETSYPYSMSSRSLFNGHFKAPVTFSEISTATNSEFFTGGYDQKNSGGDYFERDYNAAFFFDDKSKLKDVYHKKLLIPFGETLPFGPLNKLISQIVPNIAFFSKGEKSTLFQSKAGVSFIAPICYEILYADFIRDYLNANEESADIIVNLTNDSWYEQPEPRQHLYLARWRALEFNIPIIRSTNTGITTLIHPDGTMGPTLGRNKRENLDFILRVPSKREKTIYEKLGLWGSWILLISLFGLSVIIYLLKNLLLKDREASDNQ